MSTRKKTTRTKKKATKKKAKKKKTTGRVKKKATKKKTTRRTKKVKAAELETTACWTGGRSEPAPPKRKKATVSLRKPLGVKPVTEVVQRPTVEEPIETPVVETPVVETPIETPIETPTIETEAPIIPFPAAQPGWVSVLYEGEGVFVHREAGVFVKGTRTSLRTALAEKLKGTRGFRLAG